MTESEQRQPLQRKDDLCIRMQQFETDGELNGAGIMLVTNRRQTYEICPAKLVNLYSSWCVSHD